VIVEEAVVEDAAATTKEVIEEREKP